MALAPISARLMAALAACAAGPALLPAAARADPEVPIGAICDAVSPSVAGSQADQDEDQQSNRPDPMQSLAKAQQLQGILNRLQQNGGLTGGTSGGDIGSAIRSAQSGDIGGAAGAGIDLLNILRPQFTGQGQDGQASQDGQQNGPAGQDDPDSDEAPAAQQSGQNLAPTPSQGSPLVDPSMLDTARNTVRQDCERLKENQAQPAASSDDASSDDAN